MFVINWTMYSGNFKATSFYLSLVVLLGANTIRGNEEVPDADVRVNQLSEQVLAVLEHYKSPDPVGLPGAPIPDPMPIPDMQTSLTFGTLTMKDQYVHGLSKFRIESGFSNLADMEVFIGLSVDVIQVLGKYSIGSLFSRTEGASNTTLIGLYAEGMAKLEVAREGHLEATDISLDLSVTDIDVHLENRGFLGSMLQGFLNTIGTLVFDTMKPFIMNQVNTNILGDVNKNLRDFKMTFPNSLSPLDMGFAEGRRLVRKMGYDPYKIDDFTHTTGILGLDVTHVWVSGLATFHRVGNITVSMENNTVYIGASVGTQKLEGHCHWKISMAGLVSTTGKVGFSIEYLEVNAKVNQSLDVRNKPNLEDLKITLGNFQLQFDGAGTLDYVIEAVINILPNLLRHQIMLAIEVPLKIKMQEIFSDIDVEKTIKTQVQELESEKK
uniref:Lipid-binding serum glycoprotein N-terminal domain-containing protein n=1 Tax=Graphocephala atropunctata TaxID=36148 RepID=A0A1B6MI98_9HEMI